MRSSLLEEGSAGGTRRVGDGVTGVVAAAAAGRGGGGFCGRGETLARGFSVCYFN